MHQNDLRQLQRLGIDIWTSPETARELIVGGQAKPIFSFDEDQASRTSGSGQQTARAWTRRRPSEPAEPPANRQAERQINRSVAEKHPVTRESTNEQQVAIPFTVHLRVFLYGPAALVVEYSTRCPDLLMQDILRAINGFEEHQLNELHFKFPLIGLSERETTIATLAGAQEGFHAWFEQRAAPCESILVIGGSARDTSARLREKTSRTIFIDELPATRTGKQKLWNQIKNLSD